MIQERWIFFTLIGQFQHLQVQLQVVQFPFLYCQHHFQLCLGGQQGLSSTVQHHKPSARDSFGFFSLFCNNQVITFTVPLQLLQPLVLTLQVTSVKSGLEFCSVEPSKSQNRFFFPPRILSFSSVELTCVLPDHRLHLLPLLLLPQLHHPQPRLVVFMQEGDSCL